MEKLTIVVLGGLLVVFGLILLIILGSLVGAFCGEVVSWIFPETLGVVAKRLFGVDMPGWQLGAALGFVGSFFKASCSSSK
jgi:hypothetical protein